jgi:hypothetical protein
MSSHGDSNATKRKDWKLIFNLRVGSEQKYGQEEQIKLHMHAE